MKISIITVCLNSEKTIEQTIKSVVSQEDCDYEYIVIDGNSTDRTLEIIEKYRDRISAVISEPDSGIYDAMNKGIALATGDIIGIINSDDWYEPGVFALVEKCFRDTGAEVVYGKLNVIHLDGKSEIRTPANIENLRYEMAIPHPTVFVKSNIYKQYGVFQLKYKIAADYELMLRFYVKKVKFQYMKQILANFRLGGISSRKAESCLKEAWTISSEYLPFAPLSKRRYLKNVLLSRKREYVFEKALNDFPDVLCEILRKELKVSFENEIVIFGAGNWGKKMRQALLYRGKQISFWVDNDSAKWNRIEKGIRILNPDSLKSFHGIVLVAVNGFSDEISRQINKIANPLLHCVYWEEIGEVLLYRDGMLPSED